MLPTSAAQNKISSCEKRPHSSFFSQRSASYWDWLQLFTSRFLRTSVQALTRLLQGRVRPFMVSRNFNETIGYVTDRKAGPFADGNVTYFGEYAGQASYGLINVQVPQHHPFSSPIDGSAIKKVGLGSLSGVSPVPSESVRKTVSHLDPRLPGLISSQHGTLRAGRARPETSTQTFLRSIGQATNRSSATRATCFRSLTPRKICIG